MNTVKLGLEEVLEYLPGRQSHSHGDSHRSTPTRPALEMAYAAWYVPQSS